MPAAQRRQQQDIVNDFDDLENLRLLLEDTLSYSGDSLTQYRDVGPGGSGGWFHLLPGVRPKQPGSFSRASTATCLAFVRAAEADEVTADQAQALLASILASPWESAGLEIDNPFTVSFLLEAIHHLLDLGATFSEEDERFVREKIHLLQASFSHDDIPEYDGGVAISPYPPTAFLTFKAVRTLRAWELRGEPALESELRRRVGRWAWSSLNEESVLVAHNAEDADVFELAYAVLTVSTAIEFQEMTPPQREVISYALDQFFSKQSSSGNWPRSRPLFLYPELGNAYCYDYELLVALLADVQLRPMLRAKLDNLRLATAALERRRFPLDRGYGWSSGHLRQVRSAESWSTASVFHYCYELERLVTDEIRETVFDYVGDRIGTAAAMRDTLRNGQYIDRTRFLDSSIELGSDNEPLSLVNVIESRFLEPIHEHLNLVEHGRAFPKSVPTSAILYGPPGTSKTQLASLTAKALGWPLLRIDPSHLTRQGLDRLHAEAYRLFGMLQATERTVVLLDEFDELVRERDAPNEVLSRFLTTAMLPKLAALSDRRRLVVLLATNHLESFDIAVSRPGRFDMIVPVMPPTLDAKLAHPPWSGVAEKAGTLGIDFALGKYSVLATQLADLTFAEFGNAVPFLSEATNMQSFREAAETAHSGCTLMQVGEDQRNWKQRTEAQRPKIRIPLSS